MLWNIFKYLPKVFLFIPCCLIGLLLATYHVTDKIHYSKLRVAEVRNAIARVTEFGEVATKQYIETGGLPSIESLNTFQIKKISRRTILVSYKKLGVPFTPSNMFKIYWYSGTNMTSHGLLKWQLSWWLLSTPWLVLALAITLIPFWSDLYGIWVKKTTNLKGDS